MKLLLMLDGREAALTTAAVAQLHHGSQRSLAPSIWSRVKRPCAAAKTGDSESMSWQESFTVVEISVPDYSVAQHGSAGFSPAHPAIMTPCRKKN